MNREKALYYLLLRNIYACRHLTEKQKCEELSKTLSVRQIDKRAFTITWENGGEVFFREIPYDQFQFFASSDCNTIQSFQSEPQKNNTAAREIVYRLLNINPSETIKPPRKGHVPFVPLFGMGILIIALLFFGESPQSGIIIFGACLLTEFLPQGRLLSSVLLIGLFSFIPWTAVLTAFSYGFFQFADPNRHLRTVRVLSCLIACAAGLFYLIKSSAFGNLIYLPLIIPAGLLVVLRNTWTIHWRAFPMVLPFVCVGFLLDNKPIEAAVVGIYCLLELLILYVRVFFPFYHIVPHLYKNNQNA